MLIRIKYALLLGFCFLTTACISVIDPDDSDIIESYYILKDSQDVVVDPSYKYDVSIEGDSNKVTLKGNIQDILITGSYNYVIIDSDSYVDELSITGMNNIVITNGEQELFMEVITLSGNRNIVDLDGYDALTDTGEDNQVLNTDSVLQ